MYSHLAHQSLTSETDYLSAETYSTDKHEYFKFGTHRLLACASMC